MGSPHTFKETSLRFYIKLLLQSQSHGYASCRERLEIHSPSQVEMYPTKNQSSFIKEEEEAGYWEVTGSLCSNNSLIFDLVLSHCFMLSLCH